MKQGRTQGFDKGSVYQAVGPEKQLPPALLLLQMREEIVHRVTGIGDDGLPRFMHSVCQIRQGKGLQEGVAASQADLVVISADGLKGMGGEAGLWKLPGLAQTPAGRHKQLLTIDDMALLGFGPRTPQAIIALRNKAEQLP